MNEREKKILVELFVNVGIFLFMIKYSRDYKELKEMVNNFKWSE